MSSPHSSQTSPPLAATSDPRSTTEPRAQTVPAAPERFRWQRFDERDGLPSRYGAWTVHEDRRGLMWVGTNGGGVARFDGLMWRVFTPGNSGLTYPTISARCILGRADGTVWFGTGGWDGHGGGVNIYHPETETWTALRAGEWGLRSDVVTAMAEDRHGRLWFGHRNGEVSIYTPEDARWSAPAQEENLLGHAVSAIHCAPDDQVWFGTFGGGLWRLDPSGKRWERVEAPEPIETQILLHICERHDGTLWFASLSGACVLDPRSGAWRAVTRDYSGLAGRDNRCFVIRELRDGRMAIGLNHSGFDLYDPDTGHWQNHNVANSGLVNDTVSDIHEREDGTLWLCSLSGGVSVYEPGRWRTFTAANSGLPHDTTHVIRRDVKGRVWLGTSGGVARYDPRTQAWDRPGGAAPMAVGALAETPDGRMWAASGTADEPGGGVAVYDPNRDAWECLDAANTPVFVGKDGLPADVVFSLCPLRDGTLWVGGGTTMDDRRPARLLRYDPATGAWEALIAGGESAEPAARYTLHRQRGGDRDMLWIAATFRDDRTPPILTFEPRSGQWEIHDPALPATRVTAYRTIREDGDGTLWFCAYGGVVAFDGREWRHYHVGNSGLASNSAWEVYETRFGGRRLHWFATHGGVTAFDGETWETLTAEDGLAGTACFAIGDSGDGALWFATPTGVSRYVPRTDVPETFVVSPQGRVHWRDAENGARRLDLWDDARHADENDARLRLGAYTLAAAGGPQPLEVVYRDEVRLQFFAADPWRKDDPRSFWYSCRLDGGPWTPFRREPGYRFTHLSNGEHIVEVRAKNRWLNIDPTPARISFRVNLLAEQLERERVRRDLQIGRQIQSQILASLDVDAGPFTTAARLQPAREVGGDFYRIFPLEKQQGTDQCLTVEVSSPPAALTSTPQPLSTINQHPPRLGLTLGDASGKGVPGALYMAVAVTLIQAHARRLGSPGAVLAAVNEELHPQMRTHGGPRMFVTAFYGALDTETRTLTFASAGHTPPLLLPRGGAARYLRHPGLPLGAFAHTRYTDQTLRFEPGDTLLLMSDGFVEAQHAGSSGPGEMFGYDRLRAAAEQASGDGLPALIDRLFRALFDFARANARRDDLTVLALRCTE